MSYANAKARLVVHAQTAAASLARPIEDVQAAFPLPKSRCVRVYYGGETDPVRFTSRYTFDSEMVGKVTFIAAFWPITSLDEELAVTIDAEAEAFSHALRTAVDGDSAMNGAVDNTTLEDGTPDIVIVGTTRFLMILWRAVTDYVEYTIRAPQTLAPYVVPLTSTPEAIVDSLQTIGLILEVQAVTATAEIVLYALQSHGLLTLLDPLTATPEDICDALILAAIMAPS